MSRSADEEVGGGRVSEAKAGASSTSFHFPNPRPEPSRSIRLKRTATGGLRESSLESQVTHYFAFVVRRQFAL